jgi:acyl-CoA thioester hydrolase
MARVQVDIPLRWGDQDEYGHINNVSIARYLEEARVRVFSLGAARTPTGMERLFAGIGEEPHKMLLASQHIEFVGVLHFGATPALIELWVGRLGGSNIEVHCEVIAGDSADRRVVARSISHVVLVDGLTLRPKRMSEAERATLTPWQDEPLRLRRG